jgi:hypothetical protein
MPTHQTTLVKPKHTSAPFFTPSRSVFLQRKCTCGGTPGPSGECEECRKKRLQRKTQNSKVGTRNDSSVPLVVHEVLSSPGRPLDPATRAFMEPRFGHDFSGVRVHTDTKAAESAAAVNARAYTVGKTVVFGAGQYAPDMTDGRRLMAHELTHVVQQWGAIDTRSNPTMTNGSSDTFEKEAEIVAGTIDRDQPLALRHTIGPTIQRTNGREGTAAPVPADHRFTAEGVNVVVRRSCAPAEFGFDTVEEATRAALDAIFNTECIGEDRRTRMQKLLKRTGLDLRCKASAKLQNPGACAESTGFSIPAAIFTLGSSTFPSHPDVSSGCLPIESTVLHEIVHLTRGVEGEGLPTSCENSCFGTAGATPDLCLSPVIVGG